MRSGYLVLFVSGAAIASVGLSSCATDPGLGENSGSGGATDGGDGSPDGTTGGSSASGGSSGSPGDSSVWPGTNVGDPCVDATDCGALDCVGGVCTFPCPEGKGCPPGSYCGYHDAEGYICVPDRSQCAPCMEPADCPNAVFGDRCALPATNDRFCARDCSFDGTCPADSKCVDVAAYAGGAAGGPMGSADGGPGPKAQKMCVPVTGDACPCDSKRDGATRTCEATVGGLTCGGTETCEAATGTWSACNAGTPQPEVCDGADNDCNGTPDDGTDAAMCMSAGMPPNATVGCVSGQCSVTGCSPGFTNYPPTLPVSAGCPCRADATEPNEGCAEAKAAGSVTDANTTPLTISGRLSADGDVDWYSFVTTDSDETTTNTYHIHIEFSAPLPNNDEFEFDVIRGSTCATPDAAHSSLIEYDWCVDGVGTGPAGATLGESACGVMAPIHCGPHDSPYLVAVRRKATATGTCSEYSLKITAKGGSACDFAAACDMQVNQQ